MDEPTTGLHFHDMVKLLEVLHELVTQGNTVVVIEHNLEVIKRADWIIDLGSEGDAGTGFPRNLAAEPTLSLERRTPLAPCNPRTRARRHNEGMMPARYRSGQAPSEALVPARSRSLQARPAATGS